MAGGVAYQLRPAIGLPDSYFKPPKPRRRSEWRWRQEVFREALYYHNTGYEHTDVT